MKRASRGATSRWIAAAITLGVVGSAQAATIEDGHAAAEAWQLEAALQISELLLAQDPEDPEAMFLAARVQHMRGEHLSALRLIDRAAQLGQRHVEGLRERIVSSARYAAHFQTRETKHFRIRFLNKDEIVAAYAEPVLEAAYANVGAALDFLPAETGEKIVVEIYPDARGLAGATGLTVANIETSGTIAVCKFHRLMIISPLATANGYRWGDTIAHEFVHLVISKKSHNTIPIWLHEGIAKYYESAWKGEAGEALHPYSEKLLANATRSGKFITYAQMHPSMAKLPSQEDAALAFAEVFTTIEFLVDKFGKSAVPRVLQLCAEGLPLEQALRRVFGLGLAQIEKKWRKYLRSRKFRVIAGAAPQRIQLTTDEEQAKEDKPLETIEDSEAHNFARLGELLQLRGHHRAAIVEYEKAYQKSGSHYATLVNRLARAYVKTQQSDRALALLAKVFEAHPDDADAHLLAGRLELEQRNFAAATTHFETVRLQNPFNPEIHLALDALYQAQGKKDLADREKHFLALSRKPRPTRSYELPSPPAGEARVSITALSWGPIRIDDAPPTVAPLWNWPVAAGQHMIEYAKKDGSVASTTFSVDAGESRTLVLR